jgi:hypothetical protein
MKKVAIFLPGDYRPKPDERIEGEVRYYAISHS